MDERDQDVKTLAQYREDRMRDKIIIDAEKMNVIPQKMTILVEGRDDVTIDLTKPVDEIKQHTVALKEGCEYRIKLDFYVQREVVPGLKYFHTLNQKGLKVDKRVEMMRSYGPKEEPHSYTLSPEEAPTGMIRRGRYEVKSKLFDDDTNVYLIWEWALNVQKDW